MSILIFFGVFLCLLLLHRLPGLLVRMVAAMPRQRIRAANAWLGRKTAAITMARRKAAPLTPRRRLKLALISSTLLVLALMATTEYWSTHPSLLMSLLR